MEIVCWPSLGLGRIQDVFHSFQRSNEGIATILKRGVIRNAVEGDYGCVSLGRVPEFFWLPKDFLGVWGKYGLPLGIHSPHPRWS